MCVCVGGRLIAITARVGFYFLRWAFSSNEAILLQRIRTEALVSRHWIRSVSLSHGLAAEDLQKCSKNIALLLSMARPRPWLALLSDSDEARPSRQFPRSLAFVWSVVATTAAASTLYSPITCMQCNGLLLLWWRWFSKSNNFVFSSVRLSSVVFGLFLFFARQRKVLLFVIPGVWLQTLL